MKSERILLLFVLFLVPGLRVLAQTPKTTESEYERYVRQQQASFNRFAEKRAHEMDSLRQAANRAFNAMLQKEWKESKSKKLISPYPQPKPVEPPKAPQKNPADNMLKESKEVQKQRDSEPKPVRKKEEKLEPKPALPKPDTLPAAEKNKREEIPVVQKPKPELEQEDEEKGGERPEVPVPAEPKVPEAPQGVDQQDEVLALGSLGLEKASPFGWNWYMPSVAPGFEAPSGAINDKVIAAAYAQWISRDQEQLLGYFKLSQKKFNLNDWALLLLVRKVSDKLGYSRTQASVFEWFYLTQLGYDAILMYSDREVVTGICFAEKVYGRFLEKDGKRYSMPDWAPAKPYYTYQNQNAYASKPIEFKNLGAVQIGEQGKERQFDFKVFGNQYSMPIRYNAERVQLYASLPQSEIPFYLSNRAAESWLSEANSRRIAAELSRLPRPMDKLRFLHAMVLQGIPYKTDQEQFGKEKFCLTEETLHYPFADCEDRTFLLNRLIQTFTNWKTVGIRFPNHLALAVELEPETGMDVLRYKGRKWVYCDPTYFGADVGRVPAQYQQSAWEAVE
ncbi:MAG: hypothetical protein ACO3AF_03100 [Flavobacteriales bacterium]